MNPAVISANANDSVAAHLAVRAKEPVEATADEHCSDHPGPQVFELVELTHSTVPGVGVFPFNWEGFGPRSAC